MLGDINPEEIPGFYLVVPRGHLRVKAVSDLHRWLLQQDWRGDLNSSPSLSGAAGGGSIP